MTTKRHTPIHHVCRVSRSEAPCRPSQSNQELQQLRRAGGQARGAAAAPCRLPPAAAAAAAAGGSTTTLASDTALDSTSTATSSADEDTPLGTADLERFMSLHGITAAVVPPLDGAPLPPGQLACEVKSLVFLADTQPIVSVCVVAAVPRSFPSTF